MFRYCKIANDTVGVIRFIALTNFSFIFYIYFNKKKTLLVKERFVCSVECQLIFISLLWQRFWRRNIALAAMQQCIREHGAID